MSASDNRAGIFMIQHKSGTVFLGRSQAVDAEYQHQVEMLRAGEHHNPTLQQAWNDESGDGFTFRLLAPAPTGLSSHTLARWLADEERKYILHFNHLGKMPVVIDRESTPDWAHLDLDRSGVAADDPGLGLIERRRLALKREIDALRLDIAADESRVRELEARHRNAADRVRNCIGWRRIVCKQIAHVDPAEEKRKAEQYAEELARLSPRVQAVRAEIDRLQNEYLLLTRQVEETPKWRLNRLFWGGVISHPAGRD